MSIIEKKDDEFMTCRLTLKLEGLKYGSWNNKSIQEENEAISRKNQRKFYDTVNDVIALGGFFNMDKKKLDSEHQLYYNEYLITIPRSAYDAIKSLPYVDYLK